MKTLYFDIDGTVLYIDRDQVKRALAKGAFEKVIRQAGFDKLVCVGNFAGIANKVKELGVPYDELGVLMSLCRDAFVDEEWFRRVTCLVPDPEHRVNHIDFSGDWWYMDDLAKEYLEVGGYGNLLEENKDERVFIPDARGDGQDILSWLVRVAR